MGNRPALRMLKTVAEIRGAIGNSRLQAILGCSSKDLFNYEQINRFPSKFFCILSSELARHNITAPNSVLGQKELPKALKRAG
jgi:hypothetical protein